MPFLAIPIIGSLTVGMVVQAAVVVYGIYRGRQQAKKAKRQAAKVTEDQKTTVPSSAMIRTINYGRTVVSGRTVFAVAADNQGGAYIQVVALTPDHEIQAVEQIRFDGVALGPLSGDIYSDDGAWVTPGSPYYRTITQAATLKGHVPASGILVCDGPVTQVTALTIFPNYIDAPQYSSPFPSGGDSDILTEDFTRWNERIQYVPTSVANASIQGTAVIVPPEHRNKAFTMSYVWSRGTPHVRVWARKGTDTQTVIPRIAERAPQWSYNARLRGIPYIAAEIQANPQMFPDGVAPDMTAMILGKKVRDIRNPDGDPRVFTNNAAFCLIDYLRDEIGIDKSEIDLPLAIAAMNACQEQVQFDGSGQTHYRYLCDIELSTENDMVDNMQQILACMAGSISYGGATLDIRAGVPQTPTVALTDDDLASGQWSTRPFTPYGALFNSVKGTYSHPTGTGFNTIDAPIYESPTYKALDWGRTKFEIFDLPGVQNVYQAQRIQRLHLHLARNSLIFRGQFKQVARQLSVGQVVYYSHVSLGWAAKVFQITRRKVVDSMVELEMVEMPAAAYAWDYDEATAPDPAPNTNLPSPLKVGAIEGLKAESGAAVAKFGPNGEVKPVMRISWNVMRDINVLSGGSIKLMWKTSGSLTEEWNERSLPGTAYKEDVEVLRTASVHIQARAINAIGVPGPWSVIGHQADGVVGGGLLSGQLLTNAQFAAPPLDSGGAIAHWTTRRFGGSAIPAVILRQVYQVPGVAIVAFNEAFGDFPGMQWQMESEPIFVYPGQRLCQYVWASCGGGVRCWSMLYFDSTSGAGYTGHSLYRESDADMPSEDRLRPISGFAVVPSGIKSAKLVFGGMLPLDKPASAQRVYFARPYVGPASEGQIVLPAWHP